MATEPELVIDLEGADAPTGTEVELKPDKPEKPVVEAKPDDAAAAAFKKQIEDAQTAQAASDKRARDVEAENARLRDAEAKARTETVDSQIDAVANAIDAAKAESDTAERDYAAAMEGGDYAKAAQAQRKMAGAEAKLVRLGDSKFDLEEAKKAPKVERRAPEGDPVSTYVATRTPATQTWLKSHPDVADSLARGGDLGAIATGAHAEAVRKGLKPDTDDYFHLIETRLGLREEKASEPEPKPAPVQQQKKPLGSAPMSRETNQNGNNGAPRVTLTKGEQSSATDGTLVWTKNDKLVRDGKATAGQPIGLQEMARRKHAMQSQGYYDRAAVE